MRLAFSYRLESESASPVTRHSFTLKCRPSDTLRQTVSGVSLSVEPRVPLVRGTDQFGNPSDEGYIPFEHTRFAVCMHGESVTEDPCGDPLPETVAGEWDGPWFRVPSQKTAPGPCVSAMADSLERGGGDLQQAFAAMDVLGASFAYEKGATGPGTTAEEALSGGRGVCQDYAHIMLALLRSRGIPCRYVVGMTTGEGESHAWVEVLSEGLWYGVDPTAGSPVDGRYVRISCGRDFLDCQINKGVFFGGAVTGQTVRALVEEVPERR